jgi:hypothetical protein
MMAKLDKMDANQLKMETERKADKAELMAKMDSSQERTDANLEEMKATIKSGQEEMIKAITGASRESTEACEEKTKALPKMTEACPMKTRACMEEEESAPEETQAVAESREVPKGGTDEEMSGGAEDRTGEQCLALRHHRQWKKRAQVNGGPGQKFATARGRFTRCAVPALPKGHVRKGPGRTSAAG